MSSSRGTTSNSRWYNPAQNIITHLQQQQPVLDSETLPHTTTESSLKPPGVRTLGFHPPAPLGDMDHLDLNPQPLDQRYPRLLENYQEEATEESIELTPEEQEQLAHHVLRNLTDNLKPLTGTEYLIVIPAIIFALGACATSKDFGDKFVEGLESLLTSFKASPETTKTGVAWGIAAANLCAQFSLSTNSVITVLTRLLRAHQRTTDAKHSPALAEANAIAAKYDKPLTKKEKAYLAAVPLSAFATYKMGFDTLTGKYGQAEGLGHAVGATRYGSASLINWNFTYDQILRWRGDNDNLPIINLLKTAKKRLNGLANDASTPLSFIQALNENGLLKQLNGRNTNPVMNDTCKKQAEALVDELLKPFLDQQAQSGGILEANGCTKADCIQWISMILGALVSLTNFKAGTKVPELFGLTVAKDLIEFFSNLAADWSLGIAALGFVFGIPSWFVNLIINARSCVNFAAGISSVIADVRQNGTDALKKYWSADGALVGLLFLTSIGYGSGNGGSGYKYPPLNIVPIPIINLLLSSVVFTALGNLVQQGAAAKARDWKDYNLLERAIDAENLEDFYQTLSSPEQKTLRRLLVNNINLAFDSQIASYNKLQDGAVNDMFSEELQANLESRFSTQLKEVVVQTPPTAENMANANAANEPVLTSIGVDPMLTIEQKSQLSSIRVDPMQKPSPLPPTNPNIAANSRILDIIDSPQTRPRHPSPLLSAINSPVITGMGSPQTLFGSRSPSTAMNIPHRHHSSAAKKHLHTHTHLHNPLGDDGSSVSGFNTRLMAPTMSPVTVSPHSQPHTPHTPHTPRFHTPVQTPVIHESALIIRRNTDTSAAYKSPTPNSTQ